MQRTYVSTYLTSELTIKRKPSQAESPGSVSVCWYQFVRLTLASASGQVSSQLEHHDQGSDMWWLVITPLSSQCQHKSQPDPVSPEIPRIFSPGYVMTSPWVVTRAQRWTLYTHKMRFLLGFSIFKQRCLIKVAPSPHRLASSVKLIGNWFPVQSSISNQARIYQPALDHTELCPASRQADL